MTGIPERHGIRPPGKGCPRKRQLLPGGFAEPQNITAIP